MIMTLFSIILAAVIHYYGKEIIDFVAGEATSEVKDLALTYTEMTVLSYPAAAIALIGSGALRGAGNTKIPLLINGGMNILNIIISSVLIYGVFSSGGAGLCRRGFRADHFPLYWCGSDNWRTDGGNYAIAAPDAEKLFPSA